MKGNVSVFFVKMSLVLTMNTKRKSSVFLQESDLSGMNLRCPYDTLHSVVPFIYLTWCLVLGPCNDWVFYFPTHSMAFKIKVTAARMTPHWWAPREPRGCGSHSQRHPRWRSLRCCRQNPPSSRNHHNRQPEIDIKIKIVFLSYDSWHFSRRCSIRGRC